MSENKVTLEARDVEKETVEEKVPAEEQTVSKKQFDKTASELARLKKLLKDKETDEERIAREREERDNRLAELEKRDRINNETNALMDKGLTREQAFAIASAREEGTSMADVIGTVVKSYQETIEAYKLSSVQTPNGSTKTNEVTRADYEKMSIDERIRLKNSNPELFKSLRNQSQK